RGDVLDVVHPTDAACSARWAVHAAGIQLDHAILVWQATQADRVVIRIIFRAGNHGDGSVERVRSLPQTLITGINVVDSVSGANDDVLAPGCRSLCRLPGWLCRIRARGFSGCKRC